MQRQENVARLEQHSKDLKNTTWDQGLYVLGNVGLHPSQVESGSSFTTLANGNISPYLKVPLFTLITAIERYIKISAVSWSKRTTALKCEFAELTTWFNGDCGEFTVDECLAVVSIALRCEVEKAVFFQQLKAFCRRTKKTVDAGRSTRHYVNRGWARHPKMKAFKTRKTA